MSELLTKATGRPSESTPGATLPTRTTIVGASSPWPESPGGGDDGQVLQDLGPQLHLLDDARWHLHGDGLGDDVAERQRALGRHGQRAARHASGPERAIDERVAAAHWHQLIALVDGERSALRIDGRDAHRQGCDDRRRFAITEPPREAIGQIARPEVADDGGQTRAVRSVQLRDAILADVERCRDAGARRNRDANVRRDAVGRTRQARRSGARRHLTAEQRRIQHDRVAGRQHAHRQHPECIRRLQHGGVAAELEQLHHRRIVGKEGRIEADGRAERQLDRRIAGHDRDRPRRRVLAAVAVGNGNQSELGVVECRRETRCLGPGAVVPQDQQFLVTNGLVERQQLVVGRRHHVTRRVEQRLRLDAGADDDIALDQDELALAAQAAVRERVIEPLVGIDVDQSADLDALQCRAVVRLGGDTGRATAAHHRGAYQSQWQQVQGGSLHGSGLGSGSGRASAGG
jgi:hypothetical protein